MWEGKMLTARTRNLAEEVAKIQPALPRASKEKTSTSKTTTVANTTANTTSNKNSNNPTTTNNTNNTSTPSSSEGNESDAVCVEDVYSFPATTGIGFDILLQSTRHGGATTANAAIPASKSQSQSKSKSKSRPQPFTHLLVCDFEATCDSASPHYHHEIIEFPVVCIDVAQLRVVAEFHSFVRPTRHPILTDFCTSLTGITQAVVEAAPTLPEVLRQFQTWLTNDVYPLCKSADPNSISRLNQQQQRQFVYDEAHHPACVEYEKKVCFATDGPWDMRKFMHECSVLRDGHEFPPIFYRWVNVRHCFSEHFRTRPRKLTDMLRKLGMCFHGHPHSGIDDARNIARILIELLRRGYQVRHVSTIKYTAGAGGDGNMTAAVAELMEEFDVSEGRPTRCKGEKKQKRKHRNRH